MNIKEFIDFKTECPVCNSKLNLHFLTKESQKIRQSQDIIEIFFDLHGFKMSNRSYRFTVKITADINTNEFYIEFLDKNGMKYQQTYLSLRDSYFEFMHLKYANKNIKFYKDCAVCKRYNYVSTSIDFNHKTCKFEKIDISSEYFCLVENLKNDIQTYEIRNNYVSSNTELRWSIVSHERLNGIDDGMLNGTGSLVQMKMLNFNNRSLKEMIDEIKLYVMCS